MLLNNFVDYVDFTVSGQEDTNTHDDKDEFPEGTGNQ